MSPAGAAQRGGPNNSPGRARFRAAFPSARAAAVSLAPFAARVEVISPPEVRDGLARIGHALLEQYDEGSLPARK